MPDEQFYRGGWGMLGSAPPLMPFTRFTSGPWLAPKRCDSLCWECRRGWVRFGSALAQCGRCYGRGIPPPPAHRHGTARCGKAVRHG
jgi:hypothetical protein